MKLWNKKAAAWLLAGTMTVLMSGCSSDMPGGQGGFNGKNTESGGSGDGTESSEPFDIHSDEVEKKTDEIERIIDNYFYFDQDDAKREESYYDGLMDGLEDPYSVYYTKEEYAQLMEDDEGVYAGVGAVVSRNLDTQMVYVVRPVIGSPAEKAGLLPEDVIVAVDDVDVTADMELEEVVDMIRGEVGTTVTLTIYREGESDYLYIDLTREMVENVTVTSEMLENNIGYIKVDEFIENTPDQFHQQLDALVAGGAQSLIIDMRDNPGGLVTAVTDMCDYIIQDDAGGDGLILATKDKNGNSMEEWHCKDGHSVDLPMVVLVNGNSASAAEIFTGCMKDYGLATIVGTNTYGKGIVQSVIPLSDGSAIKITIAKYFTPGGNDIHLVGIAPDVEIDLPDELKTKVTIPHEEDTQLQKAIEVLTK